MQTFIQNLVQRIFTVKPLPSVHADDDEDELVDPQEVLREKCRQVPKCAALGEKLSTCNERVRSRSQTTETCVEEVIDYFSCVDHCVAPDLFHKLK